MKAMLIWQVFVGFGNSKFDAFFGYRIGGWMDGQGPSLELNQISILYTTYCSATKSKFT